MFVYSFVLVIKRKKDRDNDDNGVNKIIPLAILITPYIRINVQKSNMLNNKILTHYSATVVSNPKKRLLLHMDCERPTDVCICIKKHKAH